MERGMSAIRTVTLSSDNPNEAINLQRLAAWANHRIRVGDPGVSKEYLEGVRDLAKHIAGSGASPELDALISSLS